ncbi:MAG: hypothetical protein HY801_09555 [Candidatus Lindowbacteria bacterium]|nr:hypothetical protein [Candidatus Lindowbacteria bacterium]
MGAIENIFGDVVGAVSGFLVHTFVPWAWDHKMWIAALIPFIVVIAIVKWIRG